MPAVDVPAAWEAAWKVFDPTRVDGVILVAGASDTGKSTFSRYLYNRLHLSGTPVAMVDGDPGQSSLGPPAALTGFVPAAPPGDAAGCLPEVPPSGALMAVSGKTWRRFIGSTSPRGHMLEQTTAAHRLVLAARGAGAKVVVYDTSGLVDPSIGGVALKLAKIDLLQPALVVGLQRGAELEPLLSILRHTQKARLIELALSPAARRRHTPARREHRARQYARYFARARVVDLDLSRLAVLPGPRFEPGQLIALEDSQGFALALAIVRQADPAARRLTVLIPLDSLAGIEAVHPGSISVDPHTFSDRFLRE